MDRTAPRTPNEGDPEHVNHQCGSCGQPVTDQAAICHACTGKLRRDLLDIPPLLAELDTTALRQTAMRDAPGGTTCRHTQPDCGCGVTLPWNPHARHAQHAIHNAVTTWCRVLWEEAPAPDVGQSLALWLADQTNQIRRHAWAPDCQAGIRRATATGWAAIDRPPERWYAGPCNTPLPDGTTCDATLWARIDHPRITCRACDATHQVADRRDWLLRTAWDVHDTARNIASALTIMLRRRISPATIRWWASDDAGHQLHPVGQSGTARLYRVGDVITLINRQEPTADTPHTRRNLTTV